MAKQILEKINSLESCIRVGKKLMQLFEEHKYLRVFVIPGKDRSHEQNATWNAMYKALWVQCAFTSFLEARAYCKWEIGIPILKRDVDGFAAAFSAVFGKLPYERCLALMNPNKLFPSDGFPVTRHFGVKQGTEYIQNICDHFNGVDHPYIDFSEILENQE